MPPLGSYSTSKKVASVKAVKVPRALIHLIILILLSGCAGAVKVDYRPLRQDIPVKVYGKATVSVEAFADRRPPEGISSQGSRTIGDITSIVADITDKKLTLSEDPADLVKRAFAEELGRAGFTVLPAGSGADYVLRGEVREFRLDIMDRDRISLEIYSELLAGPDAVWSGAERLTEEKYAGVMGNTRGTISNYISHSLSRVIKTMLVQAVPAVSAREAGKKARDSMDAAPAAPAPLSTVPSTAAPEIPAGSGRLIVTTGPPRAKVYLNGIYYGLTPITIDAAPGIYDVSIRQKGFDDHEERVSVREGRVTEMEVFFENGR